MANTDDELSASAQPAFTGEFMILGDAQARSEADHLERYKWAQAFVQGKTVADIACGSGYGSAMLAKAGAVSVTGIDISESAIAIAQSHYADETVRFEQGDITTWGQTASVDLITSFETIEHLSPTEAALSNLHRVLKPGGLLFISSPNRPITSPGARDITSVPRNKFHVKEFTPAELRSAMEFAGFEVQQRALGQRLEPPFPLRWRERVARKLHPEERLSPRLRPFWIRVPRYFVLVGVKPD